ncbi:hypothetical protein CPB83DRAFT_850526 [Crepidotus variabilis]|uniref:Uncharacterized protein n=1 Tax=Crepidotus variabilis TaxID=179855 RepID=A0A9P6JRS7_9AGAR|nr:hypothetical protein CPB83DRAFT_850526 [Crepidotus variabilis]
MYSVSSQRDSRTMPFLASHFPQPPQHTGFDPNIHGQSDADFYHSPFDENEEENQGDVDDGLAPMAVPVPARSSTSTTSSRSMVSASSQPFGPGGSTSSLGGNGGAPATMTKAKWNLKLQLQHLQPGSASRSTSSLPPGQTAPSRPGPSVSPQVSPQVSPPAHEYPMNLNPTGVSVDTDVYKNAYNYPLAKQLSPIAEQDYFSPSPHSSRDKDADAGSMSFRFGGSRKASPGVESVLKLKPSGAFPPIAMADTDDRASIRSKTGSVRSSAGSVRAHGMSRPPSGSDGPVSAGIVRVPLGTPGGSDMPKPSPFISRPLNRTVSQTSSKAESVFQGTPSHSQPTTPRLEGYIPAHVQAMQNRMIAQLSTSSISPRTTIGSTSGSGSGSATIRGSINTPDREVLPTPPNSAGATPVTATSPGMFTPSTGMFQTPISPTPRSPYDGSTPPISIQPPPGAMTAFTPPTHTVHGAPAEGSTTPGAAAALHKIPSIPAVTPIDLRFSMFGTAQPQAKGSKTSIRRVDKMPVIEASVEGYYDDDEDVGSEDRDDEEAEFDEEYDEEEGEYGYERESLHADSFVTAGASHNGERGQRSNVELAPMPGQESLKDKTSAGSMPRSTGDSVRTEARTINQRASIGGRGTPGSVGESFIHRRWDRVEGYGNGGPLSSSPETTFKAKKEPNWAIRMSSFTPAFWAFWLGFLFPVLWLVGGWHFTNAGEMPPKYTVWEWYFWNRRWRARSWFKGKMRNLLGCWKRTTGRKREARKSVDSTLSFGDNLPQQRRQGRRRSSKARAGKVYPALPRWVAEKQSTDDGRMRLNDPKRSLRGIQFGYPFISRPPTSQASYGSGRIAGSRPMFLRILTSPNRLLDQLYGVKLKEVRGRPESGRRMFDPWVQRSRYAFCYGLLLLAAGLCTACVYLISINTKNLHKN